MTRVAAVDCGTNSLRLLIADVDLARGTLVDVDRRMEIVRLGEGVDRTGRIAPEALLRTLAVARTFSALCADARVERIRFVATSATRDAANRDEFVSGVRAALGVEPEVISGQEEAALSFVGATRGLNTAVDGVLVVDIGGGSTEVVLGSAADGGRVVASRSVDVGCVRLTERQLRSDPPTPGEVKAALEDVDGALDLVAAAVPLADARVLVGLAGSVTTVTAHALGLATYDSATIHGSRLSLDLARSACSDLLGMTRAERAALPYLHPGRVDVIGAGALTWWRVLERVAAESGITEAITSEHDILDGIAWAVA